MLNIIEVCNKAYELLNSEDITALINAITLSSYVKKSIAISGMNNLKKKLDKYMPEGIQTKKQKKIFIDSCISLENFIKKSENLDYELFEEINNMIINGLLNEEEHLRLYLNKVTNLSIVDLIVLKEVTKKDFTFQEEVSIDSANKSFIISTISESIKIEKALVELAFENLVINRLVNEEGINIKEEVKEVPINEEDFQSYLYTTYSFKKITGEKIVELLEKNDKE